MTSIKKFARKAILLLTVAATLALSLIPAVPPANTALAVAGTTVQINNGNPINTLVNGQSIVATNSAGIPITVNDLPDMGAPVNGLAGLAFDLSWDKNVITVTNPIKVSTDALLAGWSMTLGTPDNSTGTVTLAGTNTNYSTDNITLFYLGITAVGAASNSTVLGLTITDLIDNGNIQITPRTSVNTTVTISWGTLNSITVTPPNPAIPLGLTQQMSAIGNYSGGTNNITTTVNWTSSSPSVATIGLNTGLISSVSTGTTTITATYVGPTTTTNSTVLSVLPAQVVGVAVTPTNTSLPQGLTRQFSATGTMTDGTTTNITATANWTSSNTTVATINGAGVATAINTGTTTITATYGAYSGNTALFVTPAELISIAISPTSPTIVHSVAPGTQQFTATGTFTNGPADITTTANWTSSNTSVATIGQNTGLATSVWSGTTNITATWGTVSNKTPLNVVINTQVAVNNGTLIALDLPANSGNQTGIPVAIKNIPAGDGVGGFVFNFTWDPAVINVTNIAGATIPGFNIVAGTANNTGGTANVTGASTGAFLTGNTTVALFDVKSVGGVGTNTPLAVTITVLSNNASLPMPALPVNATAQVSLGELQSIAVTPASASVAQGLTQQFAAMGTFAFGARDITGEVTWNSSSPAAAGISSTGLATGNNTGSTNIWATSSNISGPVTSNTAVLTVTPKELVSIAVTPPDQTIPLGRSQQLSAIGTYTDLSTANITAAANWTSINTGVATIGLNTGLAASVAQGTTTITATWGSISGNTTLTVAPPLLLSIAVSPSNPGVPLGLNQQFSAMGTWTNGTTNLSATANWTSGTPGVATIGLNTGLATTVSQGSTLITATMTMPAGNVTGSTTLYVIPPVLLSIAIAPTNPTISVSQTRQFTATGTFTNGPSDITTAANWTSGTLGVATIGQNTGLATAVGVGTSTITATWGTVSNQTTLTVTASPLQSIVVTPDGASIPLGLTKQMTATGTFLNTTTGNITASVTWNSSNISVATINSAGLAQSVGVGTTNIWASSSNSTGPVISANVTLNVTPAELVAIVVTPPDPSVAAGRTKQFSATGTYTDSTTANLTATANWTSSSTAVATIGVNTGLATSNTTGTTTITATWGTVSGNTLLTVTPAVLDSITVTPANPTIYLGLTQQFTATGNYSNNTTLSLTANVTWASSNPAVATIAGGGLATSVAEGTTTVSATLGSVVGSTLLTIAPPNLLSIAVTPAFANIPAGTTQQFAATGTYTNGITVITGTANWSSSNTGIATIGLHTGLASGVNQGDTVITASITNALGTVTSPSASLRVAAPTLLSISITPNAPSTNVTAGNTIQFTATGTFTTGTGTITNLVNWTTSNTGLASIQTTGQATPGLAKGLRAGSVTITANMSGVTATAPLTVLSPSVRTVTVTPVNPIISGNGTVQFRATAIKSDDSLSDVTSSATWASSNPAVASVSGGGLATSLTAGNTTITATSGGQSGSTLLIVTGATLTSIAVTPANPPVAAGNSQQFMATGTYTNLDLTTFTIDLTNFVNWSSSNTAVARITRTGGFASTYAIGSSTITAALGAVSGTTTLTVTAPELASVVVTPATPTIQFVAGAPPTLQFKATAVYTDGSTTDNTTTAAWASGTPATANVTSTGLATAKAAGTSDISATLSTKVGISSLTVLADTEEPHVTLNRPSDGIVVRSTTLTVTGTITGYPVSANVTVNGGAPQNIMPLGTSDNFSIDVTLNVGMNTILVTATDNASNVGASGTRAVSVSPLKPAISITTPEEGTLTRTPSVNVNVTCDVASSITLWLNGASAGSGTGNFSVSVTLAEGKNILIASGYAPGQSTAPFLGTSGPRLVVLDTTKPVVSITSPASGSYVNAPGIVITGNIDDKSIATATLTVGGGAPQTIPVNGGNFRQSINLAAGANTITVSATDAIGNVSVPASVTVTFDNTKPEVKISTPANGQRVNTTAQLVTGNVSDPSITTATLLVNGVAQTVPVSSNGSVNALVTLAAGANTIELRASDAAANTGTSGVVNLTVDTTPPVVQIRLTDPTDTIEVMVETNEALASVPAVTVNGAALIMETEGATEFEAAYGPPLPSGNYSVIATGTDLAGNTATNNAYFAKSTVTIPASTPTAVSSNTTTLVFTTNSSVTAQSLSVTQSTGNPASNTAASGLGAGIYVEIVASANLTNSISSINITVSYDPADIAARGIDESTLRLYYWSTVNGKWEAVSPSGVNTDQNYIWGVTTHLSKYGSFGTAPPQPAPPPVSVGAVGGGGGSTQVIPSGLTASPALLLSSDGTVLTTSTVTTTDGKVSLLLTQGTKLLGANGMPITTLSAAVVTTPAGNAPSNTSILTTYDIGPNGTTFTPGIPLTISYSGLTLPKDAKESDLYIAFWDGSKWVSLPSTVNTVAKTVTATTTHLTQFTLISPLPAPVVPPVTPPVTPPAPKPAAFSISGLSISPSSVGIGEKVTISVKLANTGETSGTYKVSLKINNEVADTKDVTLIGGASQTVSFTVSREKAGTYDVSIDSQSGTFTVTAPEPPPPPPPSPVTPPVTPPSGGVPVWVWIIIAVVVIGAGYWIWRIRTA